MLTFQMSKNSLIRQYLQAVEQDDVLLMKKLIKKGVRINDHVTVNDDYDSGQGKQHIHIAAQHRSLNALKYLLELGADINASYEVYYADQVYSPLIIASENKDSEMCKYLVQNGADVNVNDKANSSPIMNAVEENNLGLVRLYVEHGASPYSIMLSLSEAGAQGYLEIADYLLDKVDNKYWESSDNITLLLLLQRLLCFPEEKVNENKLKIIEDLLSKGIDLSLTNWQGETALNIAARLKDTSVTDLINKYGK